MAREMPVLRTVNERETDPPAHLTHSRACRSISSATDTYCIWALPSIHGLVGIRGLSLLGTTIAARQPARTIGASHLFTIPVLPLLLCEVRRPRRLPISARYLQTARVVHDGTGQALDTYRPGSAHDNHTHRGAERPSGMLNIQRLLGPGPTSDSR